MPSPPPQPPPIVRPGPSLAAQGAAAHVFLDGGIPGPDYLHLEAEVRRLRAAIAARDRTIADQAGEIEGLKSELKQRRRESSPGRDPYR